MLQSIIEMNWYNHTLIQTSDNVDAIISDFEFAFGEFEECQIVIKPTVFYNSEKSMMNIDESGSFMEVVLEIHYRNPYNPDIDAALIIAKSTGNIVFEVGDDFKLYGNIDQVTVRVLDF